MLPFRASSALLIGLLAAATSARAEMPSLFGLGPKSQAMGGVSVIEGESSPFQVYGAPAALGFLHHVEFDFGAQYFQPNLKSFGTIVTSDKGTTGDFPDSGVLPGGGSLMAFAVPLGKTHPLTIGGAIYMPFTTMIRVSGTPIDYPFYPLYSDIARNFFFVVGAGWEVVDGLAIGVNVRSTTKSTVSYVLVSNSNNSYSASATEARSESRLSYSVLYDHGRIDPKRPFTIGAMYRGHSGMETKISADINAFVPIQGTLVSMPAYTPAEWVAMGSFKMGDNFIASGELARVLWSKYNSPYGNGNINAYVIEGRVGQANFKDIWVPRVGFEQVKPITGSAFKKVVFREGYMFYPSPVPDQTGNSNYVDSTRHMISAGLGTAFANPWHDNDTIDVDFFFQYNRLNSRQVSKDATNNIGAPGYVSGGNILLFGTGVALRF